jgi:hypothetical protein
VASVRANQIAREMPALGDWEPADLLRRSGKAAEFHKVFHCSNLWTARFL